MPLFVIVILLGGIGFIVYRRKTGESVPMLDTLAPPTDPAEELRARSEDARQANNRLDLARVRLDQLRLDANRARVQAGAAVAGEHPDAIAANERAAAAERAAAESRAQYEAAVRAAQEAAAARAEAVRAAAAAVERLQPEVQELEARARTEATNVGLARVALPIAAQTRRRIAGQIERYEEVLRIIFTGQFGEEIVAYNGSVQVYDDNTAEASNMMLAIASAGQAGQPNPYPTARFVNAVERNVRDQVTNVHTPNVERYRKQLARATVAEAEARRALDEKRAELNRARAALGLANTSGAATPSRGRPLVLTGNVGTGGQSPTARPDLYLV